MVLELTGEGGKPNPFNPVDPEEEARQEAALRNKKTGLFGSALEGGDAHAHAGVTVPLRQPFSRPNSGHKDRRPAHNERRASHDGHDDRSEPHQHKQRQQQTGGGRGGGRGGGQGGNKGGRQQKPEPTSDQLDADMDAYFAAK